MTVKLGILCFSPTGGTSAVLQAMADAADDSPIVLDLTPHGTRSDMPRQLAALKDVTHLMFGVPVYAGAIPSPVLACIATLDGRGLDTAAVVVYGNRGPGQALRQLTEALNKADFRVTAGASFVAKHSLSSIVPVAIERPDTDDRRAAKAFVRSFVSSRAPVSLEQLPIESSWVDKTMPASGPKPELIDDFCTHCGVCSRYCAMGVLDPETHRYVDRQARSKCLGCQACVARCPSGARKCQPPAVVRWVIRMVLKGATEQRREPWFC